MFWVGLTGGIASGKSTVARHFETMGFTVINADQLAHAAMAPGSDGAREIRKSFGDGVFLADGNVDRAQLGRIIFDDASHAKRLELEKILHPEVRKRAEVEKRRLEARGDRMAVYEIPLLFEKKLEDQFDLIITVAVSPEIQIERLMARSGLNREEAQNRIRAQLAQDQKILGSDFVIWNNGGIEALRLETERIAGLILDGAPRA